MSYNVCLLGAKLDSGNMGVSALAASLINIILRNRENANISLLISNRSSIPQGLKISSNEKISLTVANYRLSPKANLQEHLFWIFLLACIYRFIPSKALRIKIFNSNPFLNKMSKADFIGDIRGGDSFSDIYGLSTLIVGSMPVIIAFLLNKNVVLFPQTYGPNNSFFARILATFILKRAHYIFSRDRAGLSYLKNILKTDFIPNIKFCPDVAFMLDPIKPDEIIIIPPIPKNKNFPLFGFNVSGLMYLGEHKKNNPFGLKMNYKSFSIKIAATILQETDAHILFVPHTFSPPMASDPDACIDVLNTIPESFKNRIHIVAKEYDQSEIKSIIGLCDFFVGSRMHACIAALSQGIPTVGVAYSKKFIGVFESVDMEDSVIDGRAVDTEGAVGGVLKCFQDRKIVKEDLLEKISLAKRQVVNTFQKILSE